MVTGCVTGGKIPGFDLFPPPHGPTRGYRAAEAVADSLNQSHRPARCAPSAAATHSHVKGNAPV